MSTFFRTDLEGHIPNPSPTNSLYYTLKDRKSLKTFRIEYGQLGLKFVMRMFDGQIDRRGEREELPKEILFEGEKELLKRIHEIKNELKEIEITKLSGDEIFQNGSKKLDFNLLSFWQWSSSDVVSNATRGILAEYIVGKALGCISKEDGRDEWGAYDLKTQTGISIEVKSAAYIQSWEQSKLSKISFSIRKSLGWDRETNKFDDEKKRQADVLCVRSPIPQRQRYSESS